MKRPTLLALAAGMACALIASGCRESGPGRGPEGQSDMGLDRIAEAYVKLVLAVGRHDPDTVDAYYGPPEWREEAEAATVPLADLRIRAGGLLNGLGAGAGPAAAVSPSTAAAAGAGGDPLVALRRSYLAKQIRAIATRIDILGGARPEFDAETRALFDAVAPVHTEAEFEAALGRLAALLPGSGPVHERLDRFRAAFVIPKDRLDAVMQAAIAACRERTLRRLTLPQGETFTIEYVQDKPWSAYNWYKGNVTSLIEVNTSLPVQISQAIGLACHEGYPGHHAYNALLEHHLVRGRGWVEFTVYPLFSPQSLIAEGSANYGVDLAFPEADRNAFEKAVLFPLAGIDTARAGTYFEIQRILKSLEYVSNEAARGYLGGRMDAEATVAYLLRYGLRTEDRARQSLAFIERYRTYVINYNLGQDLVRAYVERRAGADEAARWRVFGELLSTPRLPGDLQ
jgi:hypothetical protein